MAATVLLVGCGKMGGAMLDGWLSRGSIDHAHVVNPGSSADRFAGSSQVSLYDSGDAVPDTVRPDVLLLAVKPQKMAEVAPTYRRFARDNTVVLSIAAGKPLSFFADIFGGDRPIVRCMPNTPAAIGHGMMALVANSQASQPQRELCERLMAAVGDTIWIGDESLMDAVTAISGSGPAYVFLLIECLTHAGVAQGLDHATAARLATRMVEGSGALAQQLGEPAAHLRQNVASPGGTTAAALEVLRADERLQDLMSEAVEAAVQRARELAR